MVESLGGLWYRNARAECRSIPPSLPRHVAIIMDGNGRWAQGRGLPRVEGHRQGAKSVREVVRAAREVGLRALTLYAFSAQNWQRPPEEVATLMQLLRDYVIDERAEIMDNGIRLIAIGDVDRLPDFVTRAAGGADARLGRTTGAMTLVPGAVLRRARVDRVDGARAVRRRWRSGGSRPRTSPRSGSRRRCRPAGCPQLDLLIRTSGEERLSNFLLWEAAYAELYFTDTYWPDFGKEELWRPRVLPRRERRFGRTREQIRSAG